MKDDIPLSKEAYFQAQAETAKTREPINMTAAVVRQVQGDTFDLQGAHLQPDEPGLLKQIWEAVPRIGDGHLMGMMRLGGHELTQALAAFPDSNIRPMDEPGVFGNAIPQIVTKEMNAYDAALDAAANRAQYVTPVDDRDITR